MVTENKSILPVSLKYGVFIAIFYIVYTLLMQALGFTKIVELRFINGIFLAVGVFMAIREYKLSQNGVIKYFSGFGIGFLVGAIGSFIFALFMVLWVKIIDDSLLETIRTSEYFAPNLSEWMMFMTIMVEGMWPGFILGFIAMQWFKRPDHTFSEK